MKMIRRAFFKGALSVGAAPTVLSLVACSESSKETEQSGRRSGASPLGELMTDPEGLLDLPDGYSYVVLQRTGDEMSDGLVAGERPDGMACFTAKDGSLVLMRNHETDVGENPVPQLAFNPNMNGGVTRLVLDKQSLELKSSNWVLSGTCRNCAGGPSPWGWLSCEESDEVGHGYVFVCDPEAAQAQKPQRAASLGRFKHEAVAVDPKTEIIYLTEDERSSAFYRHLPGESAFSGQLQAMKVVGAEKLDLAQGQEIGQLYQLEWVDINDPEGEPTTTAEQAFAQGAAVVNRGEGCWYSEGAVFFVSTEGGPLGLGQVFRLDIKANTLTLVAQTESGDEMVNPDNITISPHGEVFIVEDNNGPNHIRRIDEDGRVSAFARNALDGGTSELCGVCFSPDGRVMFVNMQEPGITLAITGPFGSLKA